MRPGKKGERALRVYQALKLHELGLSLVDAGAAKGARITLIKRRSDPVRAEKNMTLDDVLAKLGEEERAVIAAALEAAKKPAEPAKTEGEKSEEAIKRLPPEVRAEVQKALDIAKAAEEKAAKLEQAEKRRGYVEVAKGLPFLAGKSTDQIADIIQAIDERLPDASKKAALELLSSANTAISKSASLHEIGSKVGEASGSAYGQIESIAKGLVEKDPKLTLADAITHVCSTRKELYAQYQAEKAVR